MYHNHEDFWFGLSLHTAKWMLMLFINFLSFSILFRFATTDSWMTIWYVLLTIDVIAFVVIGIIHVVFCVLGMYERYRR